MLLKDTVLLQPLCSLSWEQAWELPWVKPAQQERAVLSAIVCSTMVMVAGGCGRSPAARPRGAGELGQCWLHLGCVTSAAEAWGVCTPW